jgi:hypothetical protein
MGIKELGYNGFEVGRQLNLSSGGVSIAMRQGELVLRKRPEIRKEILRK